MEFELAFWKSICTMKCWSAEASQAGLPVPTEMETQQQPTWKIENGLCKSRKKGSSENFPVVFMGSTENYPRLCEDVNKHPKEIHARLWSPTNVQMQLFRTPSPVI